jgi:tetratricopeptide (TPR) repeat protein
MDGLQVESVDALSLDEALLLARELPHLRDLIAGTLPGVDRETSRRLALGVLTVAQGHPKLLELADGQAADPVRLAALVEAGDQAWRAAGGLPDGFFTTGQPVAPATRPSVAPETGQSVAPAADYLRVLAAWTTVVADTLAAGERVLFWFLCCLEEPDRERAVLVGNWGGLWDRLGLDGPLPEPDAALKAIAGRGLIAVQREPESYGIHPGVAEAGRAQAGEPFRDAADDETAAYWGAVFRYSSGEAGAGAMDTGLAVRAGLAAVPYLLRRQQWADAAYLLDQAFIRDPSRANAVAVLPAIEEIAARDPRQADIAATVLQVIDPAAAGAQLRAYLNAAVARDDYEGASVAAGLLLNQCMDSGRLAEALTLCGQKAGYTRQAGLGPWTELSDEVRRLQVMNAMGQTGRVLAEVERLRDHMQTLPVVAGPDDTVAPWNVRETLLDTGREAASQLARWEDALDLNAAQTASKRDRRAPAANVARARFNDYAPLLRLGRTDEALDLLLECLQVFQEANDIGPLGKTLSALADTEDNRGHGDAAIRMERDALRYTYLAADAIGIAVCYHNLGNYLRRHARQPAPALACHLAAALIRAFTGADGGDRSVRAAAVDLREFGVAATSPGDVAVLCSQIGQIPGADLHRLLAELVPDPAVTEQALRQLITQAQAEAVTPAE